MVSLTRIAAAGIAALTAGALVAGPGQSQSPVPQSDDANNWWQKRFAEKQALVKKGGGRVVFIGDSITQGLEGSAVWKQYFEGAPYNALNLGFNGDCTEHVIWRIDHGELDGYEAKVVVLMIGTNNTGHRPRGEETPIDTISGVQEVIRRIRARQPKAKIVLHTILPRGERPDDPLRLRNDVVNSALRQMANGQDVFLCDFGDVMLEPDGTLKKDLMPDFLHPGEKGQRIWARSLLPLLDRLLAEDESSLPRAARSTGVPLLYYGPRMAERRRLAAQNAERAYDVVFIGDSITHGWDGGGRRVLDDLGADYRILNLGNSGDRTENVVWRLRNGEREGYKARLFMVMIGTNNGNDKAEDVAAGIRRIIDVIAEKQPESKVLLLPIFPRGVDRNDGHRQKNEKVNEIIKGYADGKSVVWCDFNGKFLEPGPEQTLSRKLVPDLVHPSYEGYRVWETAVRPCFKEILGR